MADSESSSESQSPVHRARTGNRQQTSENVKHGTSVAALRDSEPIHRGSGDERRDRKKIERSESSPSQRVNSAPDTVLRQNSARVTRQASTRSEQFRQNSLDVQDDEVFSDVRNDTTKIPRRQDSRLDPNAPPRLLVVSSKVKNSLLLQSAVLPNVTFVQYKYETASLDNILSSISQHLGNKKILSLAFLVHSSNSSVYISGRDDKTLTGDTVCDSRPLREFFQMIVQSHVDRNKPEARVDFLACNVAHTSDSALIARDLESLLGVTVAISKEVTGSDIQFDKIVDDGSRSAHVGDLYFRMDRLKWSGSNQQSLAGFEKIRTVGKGAYGTAILYRKKDDDSLVILKEINLHDLTASERQMALNEVHVLAMLDHPNIISYYDSFEEDGVVMIEMEYADGGTVAQYLAQQDKPLSEREILTLFSQIVSAIKFIHEHNILHRDLKTANIFLTKEGRVKVGDFGISKLMSTANQGANTVLGTPYYISPEMCEGKPYNDKSDIWALGCILYEMACLQKTFEGSNLPALVNKIMKGQFAPVKGSYSQEFKNLIMSMLQREAEFRPSATDVWHHRLPELMSKFEDDQTTDYDEDSLNSSGNNTLRKKKTRSVLYYFEMSQMQLTPISLPSRITIRDISVSHDHVIVVTQEQMVYTWGDGSQGQLGHGDLEPRNTPEIVQALKGKSIVRACSGSGFSVFASDNGIVMTCGGGSTGCLGHGDWCSTSRPRLIEALLSVDVACIACGPQHVVAVGSEGEVFTWGCGADGRLGLGNEENVCVPMEVSFAEPVCIRECFCGQDGTMLLTDVGSVLACGSNEYNKLGLNHRVGFLMAMKNIFNKTEVAGEKVFRSVRALARHRVTSLHMGSHHSAVIVEPGFLYTFGRNSDGQLGTGNTKPQGGPIEVMVFEEKPAFRVQCGAHFTITGTTDNDLLYWGTRYKRPARAEDALGSKRELCVESATSSRCHSRQASTASVSSTSSARETQVTEALGSRTNPETGEGRPVVAPGVSRGPERQPSVESSGRGGGERQGSTDSVSRAAKRGPDRQASTDSLSKAPSGGRGAERQASTDSISDRNGSQGSLGAGFKPISAVPRRVRTLSNSKDGKDDTEVVLSPVPLIRMDSSGSHSQAGDTVTLSQFFCHGENLFIQVETTAPPPKRRSRRKRSYIRKRFSASGLDVPEGLNGMSASSREGGDEYSSEASELDTCGTIPPWLQEELAHSEMADGAEAGQEADSDRSDDEVPALESSISSIRINRDLQHAPKPSTNTGRSHITKHGPGLDAARGLGVRKSSEGRHDNADPLSSSSSSESLSLSAKGAVPVKKNVGPGPTKRIVTPMAGPAVVKSKNGPTQGQKPLVRLRAQGKTRRSDPKPELDHPVPSDRPRPGTDAATVQADLAQKQENMAELQRELERLRAEKRRSEDRLQQLERDHLQQRETLWKAAEQKAVNRELQLQEEIKNLREDMTQQNHQLKDNLNIVLSLQTQLEKVQSEQARLNARDTQRPESRTASQRDSKICVLQ